MYVGVEVQLHHSSAGYYLGLSASGWALDSVWTLSYLSRESNLQPSNPQPIATSTGLSRLLNRQNYKEEKSYMVIDVSQLSDLAILHDSIATFCIQ
jgi:hypothetical protein